MMVQQRRTRRRRRRLLLIEHVATITALLGAVNGFCPLRPVSRQQSSSFFGSILPPVSSSRTRTRPCRSFLSTTDNQEEDATYSSSSSSDDNQQQQHQQPMIITSGYSSQPDLYSALQEAVFMAANSNNNNNSSSSTIDLAWISVSSLYDGGAMQPATIVVPAVLAAAQAKNCHVQNLIGSSVAGVVSSTINNNNNNMNDNGARSMSTTQLQPTELEGVPCVSVVFMQLPQTNVHLFATTDLPVGRVTDKEWKQSVGLSTLQQLPKNNDNTDKNTNDDKSDPPTLLVLPSPAFSSQVDDFLSQAKQYLPGCTIIGGIASTVSSLSRAKLYCYSADRANSDVCYTDGLVGVALQGDIQVVPYTALGAKPVGGIYSIVQGQDSTISVIMLDQTATNALNESNHDNEKDEEEEEAPPLDKKQAMQQFYAKAQIPKPVLAEANFLMKTLSDDDQLFMKRQLLVGIEKGGAFGSSPSELQRLASGVGHRFTIVAVASAGMKDGSVTLPLKNSVTNITPGTRLRFFVRDAQFAQLELQALWTGYKKTVWTAQLERDNVNSNEKNKDDKDNKTKPPFVPAACLMLPTMDRGGKFFNRPCLESLATAKMLPTLPCIAGFFTNAVLCQKSDSFETNQVGVQGSACGYFLLGSKSGRPVAVPQKRPFNNEGASETDDEDEQLTATDASLPRRMGSVATLQGAAPRGADGELLLKRREVHSGRALTVSTVEWSVAEKKAQPSSALEGFMWDKETEVDRFRERVPLQNLVSQCRLSVVDPKAPKPRDWVGPVKRASGFVIVPECKRMDPASGSLRKRYNVEDLVREFTMSGAPAVSVNCDPILFGGSMDHIGLARQASSQAAVESVNSEDGVVVPPILASDLILYPYQLYKLRLAGADAVNLVAGALAAKGLLYLTKIASSVQLQVLVTVTSTVQIERLIPLQVLDGVIVSNRNLEDFSFDESGQQVLDLLQSDALSSLKESHPDLLVLTEGRIGMIERDKSSTTYVQALQAAGAHGAVIGGGLASSDKPSLEELQNAI